MTFPERLDNAKTGEEFMAAVQDLFGMLEKAMEEEKADGR